MTISITVESVMIISTVSPTFRSIEVGYLLAHLDGFLLAVWIEQVTR